MSGFTGGSPGYSIQRIIDDAPKSLLRQIVGSEISQTLENISPDFSNEQTLRKFAEEFCDMNDLISDRLMRNQILAALPEEKADELAERLKLSKGTDSRKSIQLENSDNSIKEIKKFLGISTLQQSVSSPGHPPCENLEPGYGLFGHQIDAANRTKALLYTEPYKVILHMPTGAGKTRTAMHIIASHLANHNGPTVVCWLAMTKELLDQAAGEFEKAWKYLGNRPIDIYRLWQKYSPNLHDINDGVLIASYQKISAELRKNQTFLATLGAKTSLTVVDEAHQAVAPFYKEVIESLADMRPRNALLGLTATPGRTWSDKTEDRLLVEMFEQNKVMLEVQNYTNPITYLIKEGYIAKPTFRTLNVNAGLQLTETDRKKLTKDLDFPEKILESLGDNEQINMKIIVEIKKLAKNHQRIIFFSASVRQARLVAAILKIQNMKAFIVTGDTPKQEREWQIKQYKSDSTDTRVICNYGVLTTGFDAPKTSAALIARPTKSLVLYSQMVGRAIRGSKAGGNKEAEIVTVVDPALPGFGDVIESFENWEDVWNEQRIGF